MRERIEKMYGPTSAFIGTFHAFGLTIIRKYYGLCGLEKNFTIIDVDKSVILRHIKHTDFCELIIERESAELYCIAASVCANLINTVDKFAVQAV